MDDEQLGHHHQCAGMPRPRAGDDGVQPLASWEHVEGEVPDIAALARSRIDAYGLALLGTLRAQWVDPRRGATAAAQNVRATGPANWDRDRVVLGRVIGDTARRQPVRFLVARAVIGVVD